MGPSERKQSKDDSNPSPLGTSSESSSRRHGKVRRFLGKVKNVTKSIPDSRSPDPVILPVNVDREGASSAPDIEVQDTSADSQLALQDAEEPTKLVRTLSGVASLVTTSLSGRVKSVFLTPVDLEAAYNFQDTYIRHLKLFDSVVGTLTDVHPYTKIALGVLSRASKIVLDQTDYDEAVLELLKQLGGVYDFMAQDDILCEIPSMQTIVGRIVQQTLECSQFIKDYSTTKYSWKRLGSETDTRIQQYINVFQELMKDFQDRTLRNEPTSVHRTSHLPDLSSIPYAEGAGLNPGKQCLPGTCIEILSKIADWANSTDDNVQPVLWLSGPAGKGKSAIAHTLANWFNSVGGLGSCYCFDRQREADGRHEKIFSTIACDLADHDPGVKQALADAVQHGSALKNIIQQWQKFLVEPLGKRSRLTMGPILVVIEALDESGGANTRRDILRIVAGKLPDQGPKITDLPSNFRILVTSRPLPDIKDEFDGAQHILRLTMDDIPPEVAERDVYTYVSGELKGLADFQDKEFAILAAQSDGLFEWACLACKYIKATPPGTQPISRFNAIQNRDPGLLYDMYRSTLADIMPTQDENVLVRFRSVMGQILVIAEPLSLMSLNAMRDHFPDESEHCKAEVVVQDMGSLLSHSTDSSTPIKPLHTSFRDFLTDRASSGDFFIDMAQTQRDLTFASLRVMEHELRFNPCDLKSSYLLNREDPGLLERVNSSIPPHLSYSCRFWSSHLRATDFDTDLANEVKSFFDHERLLFWLEVLGTIQAVSSAVTTLPHIAQWLKDHSGYEEVSAAAMDVHQFIQTFGGIILHSTPHLYVSALSFSPVESAISKFAAKFPNTLRLASGHDLDWPAVQSLLGEYADKVLSVSFSPDGTRIVTGSADKIVRLWDAATGQPVCEPMRGHTGAVKSVSFSPDGTRIASGSYDKTIRLWDAASGQPVGEPLQGHTAWVNSVSFSPNGTCIVSGSSDNTIRLWEAATGKSIGEPLQGHTAWVNSASFSPDSVHIVSGSDDQTVWLWDAATGQQVCEPLRGHTGAVTSVSFSPDGTRITSGSYDKTVRLWDAASGQPIGEPLQGHTAWVNTVSFSPNGTRIVSGSSDNTVRLWEAATGKPIGEPFQGHTGGVGSASFSPDGTRIVSSSVDDTVRLWQAAILQPLQEYPKQDYSTSSSDGSYTMRATNDNIISTNTWNNRSICFSLDPNHALRNPAELMDGASYHDDISTSFSLGTDGWMVGPNHRLLFWVPPTSRHSFYTPRTTLVMDRQLTEVDLSRMEHGQSWQKCRDEPCDR